MSLDKTPKMKVLPSALRVTPEEPFANDLFDLHPFAQQLTRVVCKLETPSVYVLDGGWGVGKTSFINMWKHELHANGVPCVYYDAFAHDYNDDPFVAIAAQLIATSNALKPKSHRVETFKKAALEVAKVTARGVAHATIKGLTAGLIDSAHAGKSLEEALKAAGETIDKVVEDDLKKRLEASSRNDATFASFRNALADLSSALEEDADNPPLVFIIDELDRCRPSYALALLETIKHFFDAPNVAFILVSDMTILTNAVRFAYGSIDADAYLHKFYQHRIKFPDTTLPSKFKSIGLYLNHLKVRADVQEVITQVAVVHSCSLRTLERIAANTKILDAALGQGGTEPTMFATLCALRVINSSVFASIHRGQGSFEEVAEALKLRAWPNETLRNDAVHVWMFLFNEPQLSDAVRQELMREFQHWRSTPRAMAIRFASILDSYQSIA